MRWMNNAKHMAALGFLGCIGMGMMPVGCGSSVESARIQYRAEHDGPRLPDITVERLQSCVVDDPGDLPSSGVRVDARVKVDTNGQIWDIQTTGLPRHTEFFTACTESALHDMTVPDVPLRSVRIASTDKPTGNELANPGLLVEGAIVLGEFLAQHGAKAVVYAVTIEVLSAVAIEALRKLSKRCQRVREACIDSCVGSNLPTGTYSGDPYHACLRQCMERARCF